MKPDYKLVAKAKYIHLTAELAAEVWPECYQKFYPPKQLAALVETLQSADAIEADIDEGQGPGPGHPGLLRAAGPQRRQGPRPGRGAHQSPAGAGLFQGAGLPSRRARTGRCGRHPDGPDAGGKISLIFRTLFINCGCFFLPFGLHLH